MRLSREGQPFFMEIPSIYTRAPLTGPGLSSGVPGFRSSKRVRCFVINTYMVIFDDRIRIIKEKQEQITGYLYEKRSNSSFKFDFWNASAHASGVYFVRITAKGTIGLYTFTSKLMLLK